MSDHSKLKALALDVPEGIVAPAAYDDDRFYSQSEVKLLNFLEAATPAAVLALIDESERQSSKFKEWQASHHANYCNTAEERDQLKAENELLRKDAELLQSATDFVQKLCDSAGNQPSVATGYLHDILAAMGNGEQP